MNYLKYLLFGVTLIGTTLSANTTLYEDGDTILADWRVYSGSTGVISRVYDNIRRGRVVQLTGHSGLKDGFKINDHWDDSTKHILSWKMKYSQDFTFYIQVATKNHGVKYVIYKPRDNYSGVSKSGNVHIGLGNSAKNGQWHTFKRNIERDIERYQSGYQLKNIIRVLVRGSGSLDDIQMLDDVERKVYENGDNIRTKWSVYSGKTGSISRVYENIKGSKVIKLSGKNGLGDGFKIDANWNESNRHILSWSMKYSQDFTFYVQVVTKNHGIKYVVYKPSDNYKGISGSGSVRIGLGKKAKNGLWQTFTRDIKKDIKQHNSNYELAKIIRVLVRGSGMLDDIELQSVKNVSVTDKKIFIIGTSTVRYDRDDSLEGWGTALCRDIVTNSKNCFNEARQGSTVKTYKQTSSKIRKENGDTYWGRTVQRMKNNTTSSGGYLLIQFGPNKSWQHTPLPYTPKDIFIKEIQVYIDKAKALGLKPVLISPINARVSYNSRSNYPSYLKELAEQQNLLFLDLHKKSIYEYDKYINRYGGFALMVAFCSNLVDDEGSMENTYLSERGAKIVARWVKELACEKDDSLCELFK